MMKTFVLKNDLCVIFHVFKQFFKWKWQTYELMMEATKE